MHNKSVFGYCEDGRWRQLSPDGRSLDPRFKSSCLELPFTVHPTMPLQFRNKPLPHLRQPEGQPRLIQADNPEAQAELDRLQSARESALELAHNQATARMAEDREEWEHVNKPAGKEFQLDDDLIQQLAAADVEKRVQQLMFGVGDPSAANAAAAKYQ